MTLRTEPRPYPSRYLCSRCGSRGYTKSHPSAEHAAGSRSHVPLTTCKRSPGRYLFTRVDISTPNSPRSPWSWRIRSSRRPLPLPIESVVHGKHGMSSLIADIRGTDNDTQQSACCDGIREILGKSAIAGVTREGLDGKS